MIFRNVGNTKIVNFLVISGNVLQILDYLRCRERSCDFYNNILETNVKKFVVILGITINIIVFYYWTKLYIFLNVQNISDNNPWKHFIFLHRKKCS